MLSLLTGRTESQLTKQLAPSTDAYQGLSVVDTLPQFLSEAILNGASLPVSYQSSAERLYKGPEKELFQCMWRRDSRRVLQLLDSGIVSIDETDTSGRTPLYIAWLISF